MNEREHHRSIGIGTDRDSFRRQRLGPIVAHWTDVYDLDAGASELSQPTAARMGTAPTLYNLHIFRIGPTEEHHEASVPRDRGPRCQRACYGLCVAEHMRKERERGTTAKLVSPSSAASSASAAPFSRGRCAEQAPSSR